MLALHPAPASVTSLAPWATERRRTRRVPADAPAPRQGGAKVTPITSASAWATGAALRWPVPADDGFADRRRREVVSPGERRQAHRPAADGSARPTPPHPKTPAGTDARPDPVARLSGGLSGPVRLEAPPCASSACAGLAIDSLGIDPIDAMAAADAADLALLRSVVLMAAASMLLALAARWIA